MVYSTDIVIMMKEYLREGDIKEQAHMLGGCLIGAVLTVMEERMDEAKKEGEQ